MVLSMMCWWIPPPKWGRVLWLNGELGVVVGDFISGIYILGFVMESSWVSSRAAMLSSSEFYESYVPQSC